jgi:putative transcriptional regulator
MAISNAKSTTRHRTATIRRGARTGNAAGAKIVAAIEEATETLRSEGLSSPRLTVRSYEVPPACRAFGPDDVQRVRDLLGVSQAVLARFLGVSVNTVRAWEQGKRPPQQIACRFLSEIAADPPYWRRRVVPDGIAMEAKGPTG